MASCDRLGCVHGSAHMTLTARDEALAWRKLIGLLIIVPWRGGRGYRRSSCLNKWCQVWSSAPPLPALCRSQQQRQPPPLSWK